MNAPGTPLPLLAACSRWHARLELEYAAGSARTFLERWRHTGPLLVQRSFHPEPGGVCHSYLLHPPSGLVGGDTLELDARLAPGAQVLLTTPAATKCYRSGSDGATARLTQTLRVGDGACCEWLPQETLLYDGARASLATRIELAASARFIGWEITCFGRPACGEDYARGRADLALELRHDGRPLLLERLRVAGSSPLDGAGLRGRAVNATLLACGADAASLRAALDAAREIEPAETLGGVSLLDRVLVCRALATHVAPVRRWFEQLWTALRPLLLGRAALPPRIWAT